MQLLLPRPNHRKLPHDCSRGCCPSHRQRGGVPTCHTRSYLRLSLSLAGVTRGVRGGLWGVGAGNEGTHVSNVPTHTHQKNTHNYFGTHPRVSRMCFVIREKHNFQTQSTFITIFSISRKTRAGEEN